MDSLKIIFEFNKIFKGLDDLLDIINKSKNSKYWQTEINAMHFLSLINYSFSCTVYYQKILD